jgi:hypothetical protein
MNARAKNSEYVVNNAPLEIQFNINIATVLDGINGKFVRFNDKPCLNRKRENWMMPTPFVLNDLQSLDKKIKQVLLLFQ